MVQPDTPESLRKVTLYQHPFHLDPQVSITSMEVGQVTQDSGLQTNIHHPCHNCKSFCSLLVMYSIPIGFMYGVFTSFWLIFTVNVGKYIPGSYRNMTTLRFPFRPFFSHPSPGRIFFYVRRQGTAICSALATSLISSAAPFF